MILRDQLMHASHFPLYIATCNPACGSAGSGLTNYCNSGTCQCGTSGSPPTCAAPLHNRCSASNTCVCGPEPNPVACVSGSTMPKCLTNAGATPGSGVGDDAGCRVRHCI